MAGSPGARLALSAPPAYLGAGQISTLPQFLSRAAASPDAVRHNLHAYQKMQPHRRIQPDKFSHDAVLSEPLFFKQLTDAGGKPLAWEDWAGLDLVRISYLCHLLSGPEHQHSAIRHRLPTLLAALPASWRQLFQSHPAAALAPAHLEAPAAWSTGARGGRSGAPGRSTHAVPLLPLGAAKS